MSLKVLCVAEKNDAAREISRLLSGNKSNRKEGLSKFNKIYEFSCQVLNKNAQVTMTSVSGHLISHDFSFNFKNWQKCPPINLFSAPIVKFCPENLQPIKKTLEREAKKNEVLCLWTDCDREGENIASEIRDVCTAANPRMRVYRARFSEITFRSVSNALQRLEAIDENTTAAVECRQELDLRIGAAFTRFQTLRLQRVFPVLADQLISYGPCQFPTLGFVVDRYKQVQQFVSETFYKLKAVLSRDGVSVEFNWSRGRLFNRNVAQLFHEICLESHSSLVTNVAAKHKSKWRPLPLDTVEFEKFSSRKLSINAKKAMGIAEKLYTQGLISYPRTETNMFPSSMDLSPLVQEQTQSGQWGDAARQILADGPNPRRGIKSDQAHPPIHPIKHAPHLEGDEKKVYEFIVRHFLACCAKDAQGMETQVEASVSSEQFTASGLVITARNYLDVYPYDRWTDRDLPQFFQGEEVSVARVDLVEGETCPPPLLKEADLIALMEKHGIGTDATHAEHIETIKHRNYVGLQPDGTFLPGTLGMGLVEGYDEIGYSLAKPFLRAELEANLTAICSGQKCKDDVIQSMVQKYKDVFIETTANVAKLDESLSHYFGPGQTIEANLNTGPVDPQMVPLAKCRTCVRYDMYFKKTREGRLILSCAGYPECKCCIFFPADVVDGSTEVDSMCRRCPHPPVHHARLTFERGTIPYFLQGPEPNTYVGCVFCEEDLKRCGIELRCPNTSQRPPPSNRQPLAISSQPNHYGMRQNSYPNTAPNSYTNTAPNSYTNTAPNSYTNPAPNSYPNPAPNSYTNPAPNSYTNPAPNSYTNTAPNSYPNPAPNSYTNPAPNSYTNTAPNSYTNPAPNSYTNTAPNSYTNTAPNSYTNPAPNSYTNTAPNSYANTAPNSYANTAPYSMSAALKNTTSNNHNPIPSTRRDLGFDPVFSSSSINSASSFLPANPPVKRYSDPTSQPPKLTKMEFPPSEGEENFVVCNCGQRANLLTVRKDGPNRGRKFYTCMTKACDYFLWDPESDPMDTNNWQIPDPVPPAREGFHSAPFPTGGEEEQTVACRCGDPAKQLTVQKEGPNKGRQFYGCQKPRDQSCGFFQWADDVSNNSTAHNYTVAPTSDSLTESQAFGDTSSSHGLVVCRCVEPARLLTVQKEGANKGRQFYGCQKPRDQSCGFFQWTDETPASRRNNFSPPSRGVNRSFAGPKKTGVRLCSVCRQAGHNRKNCPRANCF